VKERSTQFHDEWLKLAQPYEGLVFSVPVLAEAQIAPEVPADLSTRFAAFLVGGDDKVGPRIASARHFFEQFLGYHEPGRIVLRGELPTELSFYAPEGGQELRPTFALARGPFETVDPFAEFATKVEPQAAHVTDAPRSPYFALVWDVAEDAAPALDLDKPETDTGAWRYPPTAKFERLLRHTGVPVGLLFNGPVLRLVYAPSGETTSHLSFRVADMAQRDGRKILAALELLLHARRAYGAAAEHTLEGLLAASRKRQADVTDELARQVFDAVETLLTGFEHAARRDITGERLDWLRAALETEGEHVYQGMLSIVLRLVFLLYAEDQALFPTDPLYARHYSVFGLYERLRDDAGQHPESMHHRFGAYGQLLALFRGVFLGVRHGSFQLPARRGKLFDPNAFPFLEGGLPGSTAAVLLADERARVVPPSIDDGTIYRVLRSLIMLEGQRLSYRTLDVEQLGSVYESLMGYHVLRVTSTAVRVGKYRVWVEASEVAAKSPSERKTFWKEACGLNPGPAASIEAALKEAGRDPATVADALLQHSAGGKAERERQRAEVDSLVLQPGEERRRTGTHYTPRSLTERVVKKTLEPLFACLGKERTAEQILQLKICDPAMGSGAFLVAACRQLASEVVEAWQRNGEMAKLAEEHARPELHALRLVAQQCIYGVDKNPAAVELAKLSIWLVTLSHDRPFTFLDHALRHGDSLVGLNLEQIKAFHWKGKGQLDFCSRALTEALDQAVALRSELVGLADHDDEVAQSEKRRLLEFSEQAIARIRLIADVCVGSFFAGTNDKTREAERVRRLDLVRRFLGGETDLESELGDIANTVRTQVAPFHWMLEFPEVFFELRPDPLQQGEINGAAYMEAIVGNPPFAGKNTLADGNGPSYVEWLQVLHAGAHGNSDLSAHFFRRAATLLGPNGTLGLIATNTIAQGDTRTTGLKPLVAEGWRIYEATSTMPWPGAAAVTVALVHAAGGRPGDLAVGELDGRTAASINSRLRATPERPDPVTLMTNADLSFQGCIVLGMGFTLTPEERAALVAKDPRNAERTFPYLGGLDVNSSPRHQAERWVISFGQMDLAQAEQWPDLARIVCEKVKPERDRLPANTDGKRRREFWWQYGRWTPALYAAIARLQMCLVTSLTSKHRVFAFVPAAQILDQKLIVFATDQKTFFACVQSRVHLAWAALLSSTMKTDLNYIASDCFETFPFPQPEPRTVIAPLDQIGQQLYDTRARFMVDTDQGLTKTYNALKDPACDDARVVELRTLHEAMDRAVLEAYGWGDISVPPFCPRTAGERALVAAFEDEVIDRLYQLNEARAADETRAGLGAKAKPTPKSGGKRGAKAPPAADPEGTPGGGQGQLF
jgi:hypothetical protein